ncbi:MAG: F-type H+-transporting ATPase subunit delta [Epulopiscium sp.]|jgi:F-type H+-transporting ATPase subunit delta|uniref:F0F1 ATP synthase subunit delta n=1 Tax=Defluviitalea raffinosedens TaxID=1450156 RepID=UPI0017527363|nr:F0F1 ATP synthase subunit delta [Defluviitalea raffinosedens]MBM7684545.1 F-type H+-transporting ATPase subunit delta [Defluviitalea raffinosedens]MBZ4667015.1 synthase subunit delta [Defluviitaleaceae bacterium]MDK2786821.1 F-type H+-transporting ATPase subunit delta [Candidatus Epulonipiscium sp.]HHW68352.1 F0F1 ATP synthase subunit delta [Candidatus Epulonipiscium sp.]
MAQLISKRYAKALFDLAIETNKIDELESQSRVTREILESEKEFMQILQHPQISKEEKIQLIKDTFSSKVSDELLGLLILVVQKGRQEYLLEILNTFLDEVKEHKGIVTAVVVSAVPLKNEQLEKIKLNLTSSVKKQIQIETQVDPSIIGGLKIRVGDRVLDASISGQLQGLKASLYDMQLV